MWKISAFMHFIFLRRGFLLDRSNINTVLFKKNSPYHLSASDLFAENP